MVEEYLGKVENLYAAFMDLEKAYERVDKGNSFKCSENYGGGELEGEWRAK